jgi:hypothetical protein
MAYRRRYFEGEVTSPLIVPEAVTEEKIADEAVTSRKIKDETIKSVDIGAGQVRTEDIADGAVTLSKLGADVSIVPLLDGSVTTTKLADGAVTTPKIGDSEVTSDKIKAGAVSSLKLADGAVTPAKIATNAVETAKIKDASVTKPKLADGSVSPVKLEAIDAPADGEAPTYNAATGKFEWKSAGAVGVYVPRNVTGVDFTVAAFPITDVWVPDGLDLSGIVPAGAKAVHLRVYCYNSIEGHFLNLRANDTTKSENAIETRIPIGDDRYQQHAIMALDSDRLVDYIRYNGIHEVALFVMGWFI